MPARKQKGGYLQQAQIVFDRFHVMQLAGEAVDAVRKQ
jgi:transposase